MNDVSARDVIHPGMKVLHDVHGEGIVLGITERVLPGRDSVTEMVSVEFPAGTLSWKDLISEEETPKEEISEDLVLTVPAETMLTGDVWHPVDDLEDLDGESILREIETRRAKLSISTDPASANQARREAYRSLMAAQTSDIEVAVDTLCAIVDWVFGVVETRHKKLSLVRRTEAAIRMEEQVGYILWWGTLYPSISGQVRGALDDLLVLIAQRVKTGTGETDLRKSARRVVASIEKRLETLHGATIRKNASEARGHKSRRRHNER